jgi:putative alpha-1,2-mannosidase
LYSVDPVSTNYVFGSPILDHAEVSLANDRKLIIHTINNGPGRAYIQSVRWNGKPWTRSWISHAELAAGGTLEFQMSDTPNMQFGASPDDRPPSFGVSASEVISLDAS